MKTYLEMIEKTQERLLQHPLMVNPQSYNIKIEDEIVDCDEFILAFLDEYILNNFRDGNGRVITTTEPINYYDEIYYMEEIYINTISRLGFQSCKVFNNQGLSSPQRHIWMRWLRFRILELCMEHYIPKIGTNLKTRFGRKLTKDMIIRIHKLITRSCFEPFRLASGSRVITWQESNLFMNLKNKSSIAVIITGFNIFRKVFRPAMRDINLDLILEE